MKRGQHSSFGLISTGIAAATLTAATALAQGTSATQEDRQIAASSGVQFQLSDRSDSEVLAYRQPRWMRVCNFTAQSSAEPPEYLRPTPLTSQPVPFTPAPAVDLRVTYDGQTQTISPGMCYELQAAHVRLTPVETLTSGDVLMGSIVPQAPAQAG